MKLSVIPTVLVGHVLPSAESVIHQQSPQRGMPEKSAADAGEMDTTSGRSREKREKIIVAMDMIIETQRRSRNTRFDRNG